MGTLLPTPPAAAPRRTPGPGCASSSPPDPAPLAPPRRVRRPVGPPRRAGRLRRGLPHRVRRDGVAARAPDVGLLSAAEMADQARRFVDAVDLPVVVDADTATATRSTSCAPCGPGSRRGSRGCTSRTGDPEEVRAHVRQAGRAARRDGRQDRGRRRRPRDEGLVLIARTDAAAVEGLDAAIARARAYAAAGADVLFVEARRARPTSPGRRGARRGAPPRLQRREGGRTRRCARAGRRARLLARHLPDRHARLRRAHRGRAGRPRDDPPRRHPHAASLPPSTPSRRRSGCPRSASSRRARGPRRSRAERSRAERSRVGVLHVAVRAAGLTLRCPGLALARGVGGRLRRPAALVPRAAAGPGRRVPYAQISVKDWPISPVSKRIATIALAPRCSASATIRFITSCRDS